MIRRDGVVKLVDFGIAKLVEPAGHGSREGTRAGAIVGTVSYMSPEQALGEPIDHRTDIFALGVVLYQMVTAVRPFDGPTDAAVYGALLHAVPDTVTSLRPDLPLDLDRVVGRALEKDREYRYQTAADFASELKQVLRAATDQPSAIPARRGPARDGGKRSVRLAWAVAAVASIVALAATVGLATRFRTGGSAEPPPTPKRFVVTLPAIVEPGEVLGAPIVISPDGARLVYVHSEGTARRLYVYDLERLEDRRLEGTDFAQTPVFSPDGGRVAYFSRGELTITQLAGGPPSVVREIHGQRGFAWADEHSIVVAMDAGGLIRVQADGTAVDTLATPRPQDGERAYQWPEVLPGGRTVLYTVIGSDRERRAGVTDVHALQMDTRERAVVLRDAAYARYAASGHLVFYRMGALEAVPFDVARAAVLGPPVIVAGGVASVPSGVDPEVSASFSLSRDGSLAYVPGDAKPAARTAFLVSRTGSADHLGDSVRGLVDPDLSPDGRTLAAVHDRQIWLVDIARGVRRGVTQGPSVYAAPVWTPDGQRLVYTRRDARDSSGIYSLPLRSPARETLLVKSDDRNMYPMSFTPDGRTLACVRYQSPGRHDIVTLDLARPGAEPQPLLATTASERDPQFSPDGRWIAYASDQSGRYEVYVQPYPRGNARVPISQGGGVEPRWSSTGRELFYRDAGRVMAVSVEVAASTFVAGPPRLLFAGDYQDVGLAIDYAVVRGGQHFVMIGRTEREPVYTRVRVVLNWFTDLRRLAPVPVAGR
jgi:serine/threonine-protein kinase